MELKRLENCSNEYALTDYMSLPFTDLLILKVDELEKANAIASSDPSWYGIDEAELESWRRWTSSACTQVGTVKKLVDARKGSSTTTHAIVNAMHRVMKLPNSHPTDTSNQYVAQDNDDLIDFIQ